MKGILSLVTLCSLAAFSLIYLSAAIAKKPPALEKLINGIKQNIDMLSMLAVAYGLFAFLMTPILMRGLAVNDAAFMILPMLANLTLIIMALPYMFHKIEPTLEKKLNVAIFNELKGAISGITAKEKIIGYIGGGFAVVMLVIGF